MTRHRSSLFFTLLTLNPLFGCGTSAPSPQLLLETPDSVVVDVLTQRNARFQRYHLVKDVLWQECGEATEESLTPAATKVSLIAGPERTKILNTLGRLLSVNENEDELPSASSTEMNFVEVTIRQDSTASTLRTPQQAVVAQTRSGIALSKLLLLLAQNGTLFCEKMS